MRRLAFVLLAMSLSPSAEAQLFRRLFGGGQQQHCQQPVYYQAPTYYQAQQYYPTYQAVATQEPATPGASAVAAPVSADAGLTGAVVLKQRCASCHTSGKIPRFFDGKGDLLAGAPLQEMLERITSDDPATRMPPKGQLPTREAMAVLSYAISPDQQVGSGLKLTSATERVAASEPTKRSNPFE